MNIAKINDKYINEREEISIQNNIDELEKTLKSEKLRLHRQELIKGILLQLLNCSPRRKDGVWSVFAYKGFKLSEMTEQDQDDLNFLERFLLSSEIQYEKKRYDDSVGTIGINIVLPLIDRDKVEEFIKEQDDQNILKLIKM